MHLIRVIPLSRGIFKEELTYFSAKKIDPGQLVSAPVRNRRVPALVVASESAVQAKSRIRSSSYAIKKISAGPGETIFLSEFVAAARKAARYFATTTGEVVQSLAPKHILAEYAKSSARSDRAAKRGARKDASAAILKHQAYIFQADDGERFSTYKSLIREEFARNGSVFFCLPTSQDIERVTESLERGIKEYTYTFHSGLTKKQLLEQWRKALAEDHPVLIVATGSFLSLPRDDLGLLIVDKEHSRSYKAFIRPFLDIRTFAEYFAAEKNIQLVFGDTFMRPETLWREREGTLLAFTPLKFRVLSAGRSRIVDMREYQKEYPKTDFRIISDEVHDLIQRSGDKNENLFIFSPRRGLAPLTVCNDCRNVVMCSNCTSPLVLHAHSQKKSERLFLCHKCGSRYAADAVCGRCGSWRLVPLGIGIEQVCEEIGARLPDAEILEIESDTVKTQKQAREIARRFHARPGGVLVGTEMALNYLSEGIHNSAAIGIDSLFAVPDFRIDENIFNLLLSIRTKTLKEFVVQTRDPDRPLFRDVAQGNLLDFYRNEIAMRKRFGYPPFATCVKITAQGRKPTVEKQMNKIEHTLADYAPVRYPAFAERVRGAYRENILLKLPPGTWVDETLLGKLRVLPPMISVCIDPQDLL